MRLIETGCHHAHDSLPLLVATEQNGVVELVVG